MFKLRVFYSPLLLCEFGRVGKFWLGWDIMGGVCVCVWVGQVLSRFRLLCLIGFEFEAGCKLSDYYYYLVPLLGTLIFIFQGGLFLV